MEGNWGDLVVWMLEEMEVLNECERQGCEASIASHKWAIFWSEYLYNVRINHWLSWYLSSPDSRVGLFGAGIQIVFSIFGCK